MSKQSFHAPEALVWPLLLLLSIAAYISVTSQEPLKSLRPSKHSLAEMPSPPDFDKFDSEYSRQWEDPLLATYESNIIHDDREFQAINHSTLKSVVADIVAELRKLNHQRDINDDPGRSKEEIDDGMHGKEEKAASIPTLADSPDETANDLIESQEAQDFPQPSLGSPHESSSTDISNEQSNKVEEVTPNQGKRALKTDDGFDFGALGESHGSKDGKCTNEDVTRLFEDLFKKLCEDGACKSPSILKKKNIPSEAVRIKQRDRRVMHIMPILLPGGPFEEALEARLRIRYAVVSGLAQVGYAKLDINTINRFETPLQIEGLGDSKSTTKNLLTIPFDLYHLAPDLTAKSGHAPLLVIWWINEQLLGQKPLLAVDEILRSTIGLACEDRDRQSLVELSIIGPTNSDTLKLMAKEAASNTEVYPYCESCDNPVEYTQYQAFGRAVLYSARSTIDMDIDANANEVDALKAFTDPDAFHFPPPENDEPAASRAGLVVRRLIGTDRQLVESIANELALRNAWPCQPGSKRNVILVTERDTAYGRALPKVVRKFMAESIGDDGNTIDNSNLPLKTFRYLRGLDGYVSSRKNQSEERFQEESASLSREFPAGPRQLDYLRRLTHQIRSYQRDLYSDKSNTISAIGIVGSDPYDKLLILRALRKNFPAAVFFTTDLDERLCVTSELPYTQNLIVGSHYGLSLAPDLQLDVPVFRGSYQTATYLSVLFACRQEYVKSCCQLHNSFESDPWGLSNAYRHSQEALCPLIFEIGRRRPFQLTSTSTVAKATHGISLQSKESVQSLIHPRGPKEEPINEILVRVTLVCLACILLFGLLAIYVTAVQEFTIVILTTYWNVFRLKIGVQESIAIFMAIVLAILSSAILYDHCRPNGEPFSLLEGVSVWPAVLIRTVAIVLTVVFLFSARNDSWVGLAEVSELLLDSNDHRTKKSGPYWSLKRWLKQPLVISWKVIIKKGLILSWLRPTKSRKQSQARKILPRLLNEYKTRESLVPKLVRIAGPTLLFLGFILVVFSVSNYPDVPARGSISLWASSIALLGSMFLMVLLVFVVLDSSKLAARFIRKLVLDPIDWPTKSLQAVVDARGLPNNDGVRELLMTRAIAVRTRQIGKFVIFPFIIVVLVFVARKAPLDNFDYPLTLGLVLLLTLVWIALSSFALRREAANAKRILLRRLEEKISNSFNAEGNETHTNQLRQIKNEILQESQGAFAPAIEDPIFKAIAIPFSSLGGLSLVEIMIRNT